MLLLLLQPGRAMLCAAAADSLLLRAGSVGSASLLNAAGVKGVPQLRLLAGRPMGAAVVTPLQCSILMLLSVQQDK